ncbi:23S rRNA (uracil(747)-C(5))-methyltransferase RlmC [Actinotalea sp.]|uniref:23S rRNA (uracil(747)-C(5))-methyltransferase RlmC n=1 Tax=Actinotalea sp. TaxID=1872145 RepID=UPI003561E3D1
MQCDHYDANRCRSCTLLDRPYSVQVAEKQRRAQDLLGGPDAIAWLPPLLGPEQGFRNKAKMVVTGTVERPVLGILGPHGAGVDLRDCGLHTAGLRAALPTLAEFVTRAGLVPYDVARRAGELKYLLATESPDGELMVRLVLRSTEALARIRKHLPWLLAALPAARVVSLNLQPEHKAVLEGEQEIVLTEAEVLPMRLNDLVLHLRPQGFFQTNTVVASALYRQVRDWVDELAPASVWDLYCGVGGFALHCAAPGRAVLGIETSAQAVAGARLSASGAGLEEVEFAVGDAESFALAAAHGPDVVIVNPPRRGIGAGLAGWLEASTTRAVVYSSCNVTSLSADLAAMPSWRVRRAQVLDMFPQTTHDEVLTLLTRD